MKIKTKSVEGREFTFILPTLFLASKRFVKFLTKKSDNEEIAKIMSEFLKQLKIYKKKNEKFVFIEIFSKDGGYIEVTV